MTTFFIDIENDWGCTPDNFSPAVASGNTTILNSGFATYGSGTGNTHGIITVQGKAYAINDTILTSNRTGGKMIGAGISDRLHDTHFTDPFGFGGTASRFVWIGSKNKPMMRTQTFGFSMGGIEFQGRPIDNSDGSSSYQQTSVGLELACSYNNPSSKGNFGEMAFIDCDIAVVCNTGTLPHSDTTTWDFLWIEHCATGYQIKELQSMDHVFNHIAFVPNIFSGTNQKVFDVQNGGNIKAQYVEIEGGPGITVVNTNAINFNTCSIFIDHLKVDNTASGWQLLNMQTAAPLYLQVKGFAQGSAYYTGAIDGTAGKVLNISGIANQGPTYGTLVDVHIFGISGCGFQYNNLTQSGIVYNGLSQMCGNITSPTQICNSVTSGINFTNQINALSGNLITTGSYLVTLSGIVNTLITNIGTTGNILQTEINTLSGNLNTISGNLNTSGSYLVTVSGNLNTNIANLATTGSVLQTEINTESGGISAISGTFDNFISTSFNTLSTNVNNLNFVTTNITNNLIATGATLQSEINIVSGQVQTLSGSNLQDALNTLSGNLNTSGSILQAEINTLSGNLTSSGSTLQTQVNIISSNLNTTGNTLFTIFNSLSGNLNATGTIVNTINGQLQSLSGGVVAISGTLSHPSGLVYNGLIALCPSISSVQYICSGLNPSGGGITIVSGGTYNITSGGTTVISGGSGIVGSYSGVVYSGLVALCPSVDLTAINFCEGLRILTFEPTALVSWYDKAILPLRILINDFTVPYTYSDTTLIDLLATAASTVVQEINLPTNYVVDINTRLISPDPSNDPVFTNFIVLKAACQTNIWHYQMKAIQDGIKATVGVATISQFANSAVIMGLLTDGPCKSYDKLKTQYNFNRNPNNIRAVLTPFQSNNFHAISNFNPRSL